MLRIALQAGLSHKNMFYYTYVLKSLKDGKLYVGFSGNLKNRIKEHNNGLVLATKNRIPFKLVYYEACLIKEKAIEREKGLKIGFGRAYLKRRL
jgi:putative endonuclease